MNNLDWSLQDAKARYELLTNRNIPVWVMEPLWGGRLAALSEGDEAKLKPIIFDPSFYACRVVGEIVGNAFKDGLKLK